MTDQQAVEFVKRVISGAETLSRQEVKALSNDPNPEWFCYYKGGTVKMHTGVLRQTVSGVKIVDVDGERSFFNIGMQAALKGGVGARKAVDEYAFAFAAWTAGLTWEEARKFLATLLANSLAMTPNPKKS